MPRVPPLTHLPDALPLATAAAVRVFAWPDYADEGELDRLFSGFAPELVGRDDVALCLRHDAWVDGPIEDATRALAAAFARTLGDAASLELLLIDDELAPDDWTRLARALQGAIVLPSSRRAPRSVALAALFVGGVTRIARPRDLALTLHARAAPRFPGEPLLPPARDGLGSPPR